VGIRWAVPERKPQEAHSTPWPEDPPFWIEIHVLVINIQDRLSAWARVGECSPDLEPC